MKRFTKFFWIALLAMPSGLQAQTADEIIGKHIEAIGGKELISTIKSLYAENLVSIQGNEAPSTLSILNGKGYRLETEFNGQKVVQVYTDKGGWTINPMTGIADAKALPDDQYKAGKDQIDIGGPLYNYSGKRNKVELLGKEEGVYKLKLTNHDNVVTYFYIDPNTYLITKAVQKSSVMGQDMDVIRTYSNYHATDFGYVVPFTVEVSFGGQFSIISNVRTVTVNKDIDPAIFSMKP